MQRMLLVLAANALVAGPSLAQDASGTRAADASGTVTVVSPSDLEGGANSFTEAQARARLEGAGLDSVSDLHKDAQGIWRGHAVRDGASVSVGFDYKGEIAARAP